MFDPIDRSFLETTGDGVWELYHENSKMSVHERHSAFALPPTDEQVVRTMETLRRVKPYVDCPKIELPRELPPATRPLDEVMFDRSTARAFGGGAVTLEQLSKILFMAYGVTCDNADSVYTRPFRAIPSGGALYPLEVYAFARDVEGLDAGLYHYDPEDGSLDVLRPGDATEELARYVFQPELLARASVILFVSAVFLRSTFKYGDRGYRFVLLEAGHLGQNVVLTAGGLGLAAAPIGGYLDRDVDRFLRLDGVDESVVYVLHVGTREEAPPAP